MRVMVRVVVRMMGDCVVYGIVGGEIWVIDVAREERTRATLYTYIEPWAGVEREGGRRIDGYSQGAMDALHCICITLS